MSPPEYRFILHIWSDGILKRRYSPLTILKFFLRFIRHFVSSVVRTILLEMADAA